MHINVYIVLGTHENISSGGREDTFILECRFSRSEAPLQDVVQEVLLLLLLFNFFSPIIRFTVFISLQLPPLPPRVR